MYSIMPNTYFFGFAIIEVFFGIYFPIVKIDITPINYLGITIIAFGVYINQNSKKLIESNNTTVIPFQKSNTLITTGPFKYSRNPMYLGLFIILIGEAILVTSLSSLFIAFIFLQIIQYIFILTEESMLERNFKQEYLDYAIKVNRWI